MANNKINITELSANIAQQTGVKNTTVRNFLISLNTIVRDALNSGENVKISGLGTFKVVTTEPRKSIDVNTGAEITIGSYRKVTFTPEQNIKSRINSQFAELPAMDVDENFELQNSEGMNSDEDIDVAKIIVDQQSDGAEEEMVPLASAETIDEIKNLLEEINGPAHKQDEEPVEQDIKQDKDIADDSCHEQEHAADIEAESPVQEKPSDAVKSVMVSEPINSTSEPTQIVDHDARNNIQEQTTKRVAESESEKKSTPLWKIALLIVIIFAVIFGVFYYLLIHHIEKWTEHYVMPAQETIERQLSEREKNDEIADFDKSQDVQQDVQQQVIQPVEPQTKDLVITKHEKQDVDISQYPARTTEKVIEGSRLTQISRRHYKHPDFWIYIYLANKDKFPRGPHSVVVGTELVIPDLPADVIDPNNPAAIEKAKELQATVL
jgi:nucleoid DNA-binding protein